MIKSSIVYFVFLIALSCNTFAQTENSKIKEIDFKYRHLRENYDIVKFFVDGKISTENSAFLEEKINTYEKISNFRIREITTGECIAEISKEMTADEFRIALKSQYLDFKKNSIKILSKSYYKH